MTNSAQPRTAPVTSILAATDLSESCGPVLRSSAQLAKLFGARWHVLHAFDFQALPYADLSGHTPLFTTRVDAVAQAIDEQLERCVPGGPEPASREVVIDLAHKAILWRAEQVQADLLVLGPHRQRSVTGPILGTTADRLLRTAQVPCLIVRRDMALPIRRILVPLDLSEPSRGALDQALAWATAATATEGSARQDVEARVIHVIPQVLQSETSPFQRATVAPDLRREVEAGLQRVNNPPNLAVREEVLWGDSPADTILEYARQEEVDLLVMGTHGYGAVRRALIGSVSSSVARRTPCPLLLVPAPSSYYSAAEEAERGAQPSR